MKKINILHFRNCRGITTLTGPETYLLDLLSGLDPDRFHVILACVIKPSDNKHLFIEELQKKKIPFEAIEIKSRFSIKDFLVVSKLIKKHNIDLIHTHDARSDTIGLLANKVNKIPIISFAHGWVNWVSFFSKDRLYAWLESLTVSLSDQIVIASKDTKRDLITKGISESKICHIPYGIDINKFNISENKHIKEEFNIPHGNALIGAIGRIHPWKGHKFILEAARIVMKEYPNIHFMIIGDIAFDEHKRYKEELVRLVKSLNLKENIIFTGSRSDIPELINAMDIFILPSLREPFGIVLLEAQACGKPVIGASVGGIPEAIADGESGILVKPGDNEELATAILSLLNDRERMRTMGLAGRRRVVDLFSSKRMVEKTEEMYMNMMKGEKSLK